MAERLKHWFSPALLILMLFCLATQIAGEEEPTPDISSLVPPEDRIDDFQAARAYANVLSEDPERLSEALKIYQKLYNEKPEDPTLQWEILKTRQALAEPHQKSDSLVPLNDFIDNYDAKKAYALALSYDPETLPQALEIFEALYAEKPEMKLQWEIVKASYAIAHPEQKNASLVPIGAWVSNFEATLSLAQIYATIKSHRREALQLIYQLLEQKPGDPLLLLEAAKIYLDEGLFPEALCIYHTVEVPCHEGALQMKLARLEAELGYAKASRDRYVALLAMNEQPEDLLDFYAHGMMSWGDYYGAEKIYYSNLQRKPHSVDAQLRFVNAFIAQQRYAEAEELSLCFSKEGRKHEKEMLLKLIEIKRLQRDHFAALNYAEQLLRSFPDAMLGLELKGIILYDMKCFEGAAEAFQELAEDPDYSENAYLMLGKSLFRLGDPEAAEYAWNRASLNPRSQIYKLYYLSPCSVVVRVFVEGVIRSYANAQQLQIWADLYAEDGLLVPILRIYQASACLDPDYFPGQLNLADAYANELDFIKPRHIFEALLQEFPDNYKLLLHRARVVSWDRQYDRSLMLYDELIALNPCNLVPKLEQARVAYWAKYFDLAVELYRRLLDDTSGEGSAMALLHKQFYLELKVVGLRWHKRTMHSLKYYRELMCAEPGSALWKYEYAQALCSLGLCGEAMGLYSTILVDSPLNTLAALSYEREEMRTHQGWGLFYNYWQEKGYGELSQVGRYEAIAMYEIPLACNHRIRFAERRYLEHTYFDGKYHSADGQTAEWDCRFNVFCSAAASVTRKQYLERCFGTLYSGKGELWFDLYDRGRLGIGFKKVDEVRNYFNLPQRTQGRIWWANLDTNLNHSLRFGSLYEHEDYSDGNALDHVAVEAAYAFTEHPKVFKTTVTGEFRNTRRTNIFIYNPQGVLVNIIYPYWAPQSYLLGQVQFEWRHDYSPLEFCAAPISFYDIKLSFGNDTYSNPYWELKGEWQHEFYNHWKCGATFYVHRSSQWDGNGFWCNVEYRY